MFGSVARSSVRGGNPFSFAGSAPGDVLTIRYGETPGTLPILVTYSPGNGKLLGLSAAPFGLWLEARVVPFGSEKRLLRGSFWVEIRRVKRGSPIWVRSEVGTTGIGTTVQAAWGDFIGELTKADGYSRLATDGARMASPDAIDRDPVQQLLKLEDGTAPVLPTPYLHRFARRGLFLSGGICRCGRRFRLPMFLAEHVYQNETLPSQ